MKKTWVGASLVLTAVVLEDPLGRPTSYISLLHRLDVLPVTQPTRVLKGTHSTEYRPPFSVSQWNRESVIIPKLDTGQSPMLASPAAPLATGVRKISSVGKTNKNWLTWQHPLRDQKTNFRRSSTATVAPTLKIW